MDRESLELNDGLESALLDQRMRADRHKANFESLKAQHLALQDSHQRQKDELETLSENYDRLAHKSQEIIQTLQNERDTKIMECEELKAQVLTPIKLEQLKAQLSEENRLTYKKQVESLEAEIESLTREYSGLKYNYTFLKSEYETTKASHQSIVQELKTKHDAELTAYIDERRSLMARNERDIPGDVQRMRQLQRKNNDLQQKVKGLLSENEDLRSDREQTGVANEQDHQSHSRQIAQLKAEIKTIELERSSQSEQIGSLQREMSNYRQEIISHSEQLTRTQRELDNSKRRLDDVEHQHSMEISELKMKHLDQCRDLESQREQCLSELHSCQAQLEAHIHNMEKQDSLLADKERQLEHRVQVVREKEWEKQVILEREKIELEERLTELQQQLAQTNDDNSSQREKLDDQIRELSTAKSGLESELELSKTQLREKSQELHTLLLDVKQLSTVSRKYQTLVTEHRNLQQGEDELKDSNKILEETVRELENQLTRTQEEVQREQDSLTLELGRERQSWSSEREVLVTKMEECQANKETLSQQLIESKTTTKKLQKHYKKQVQELRDAVELVRAEQETTLTEKQALEKSLGLENQKLKRKVSDMVRKQKEFQFLLHHHPQSVLKESNMPRFSQQSSLEQDENQDNLE